LVRWIHAEASGHTSGLEATTLQIENIRWTYVFYESGLSINVLYSLDEPKERAVGFKLSSVTTTVNQGRGRPIGVIGATLAIVVITAASAAPADAAMDRPGVLGTYSIDENGDTTLFGAGTDWLALLAVVGVSGDIDPVSTGVSASLRAEVAHEPLANSRVISRRPDPVRGSESASVRHGP